MSKSTLVQLRTVQILRISRFYPRRRTKTWPLQKHWAFIWLPAGSEQFLGCSNLTPAHIWLGSRASELEVIFHRWDFGCRRVRTIDRGWKQTTSTPSLSSSSSSSLPRCWNISNWIMGSIIDSFSTWQVPLCLTYLQVKSNQNLTITIIENHKKNTHTSSYYFLLLKSHGQWFLVIAFRKYILCMVGKHCLKQWTTGFSLQTDRYTQTQNTVF